MVDISKLTGPLHSVEESPLQKALRAAQPISGVQAFQGLAATGGLHELLKQHSDLVAKASVAQSVIDRLMSEQKAMQKVLAGFTAGPFAELQKRYDALHLGAFRSHTSSITDIIAHAGYSDLRIGNAEGAYQKALREVRALHDTYRMSSWSSTIFAARSGAMADLFQRTNTVTSELQRLQSLCGGLYDNPVTRQLATELASSRAMGLTDHLGITTLKLSAFAGASCMLGPDTVLGGAAFDALFGKYRTTLDLPSAFWKRPEVRREIYEDAGVDRGLIEADNNEVIEVLIGGGIASEIEGRNGLVAVVSVGQLQMRVRSTRTKHDAYVIIDEFENRLREFISEKLKGIGGQNWFKHRVSGEILTYAKERRQAALNSREKYLPLIYYTDLGDLAKIVVQNNNWNEAFAAAFQNKDRFRIDMERLVAMRRPLAHSRPVDPVLLTEMICVANRLQQDMERDSPLDVGWDNES